MSVKCVVPSCKTFYSLTTKESPSSKKISYHMFPKDEKLRQIWIKKCGRKTPFNYDHSFICSMHFAEEDYERDLRRELLNQSIKKKLKVNAIPSRNLGDQDEDEESPKVSGRKQRYEERQRKRYIDVSNESSKGSKTLKRSAEVNSPSSKVNELTAPSPKKNKTPEEEMDEIDAGELQKLLNIILERIQCLEQELEGLTHIMEDIKGRIEKMQNKS